MTKKQNFTQIDQTKYAEKNQYSAIGSKPTEDKKDEPDYKYTIRIPADYGKYLNQIAWEHRSTVRAEIMRLIEADIKKNKEVMERAKEAL